MANRAARVRLWTMEKVDNFLTSKRWWAVTRPKSSAFVKTGKLAYDS